MLLLHVAHYATRWVDDAYITFRYARRWWLGQGMTFNDGEHLEGLTNLGWAVLMAPASASGDPLPTAQLLGLLAAVGTVLAVLAWGRRRLDPVALGLGLGLLCLVPWLPYWAVQGMETPAVALLLTLGWTRAARELELLEREARPWPLAAVFLGLAPAFRPDSAAAVAVVVGWWLVAAGRRRTGRHTLLSAGLILTMAAGLVALKLHWFGEIVPNTLYVKGGRAPWYNGLQYVASFVQVPWTPLSFALVGALLHGLRRPGLRLPALLGLTGLLVCWVTNGDFFASFRFLVPFLPAFAACLAGAAQDLLEAFEGRREGRAWLVLAGAVLLLPVSGVDHIERLDAPEQLPRTSAEVRDKEAPLLLPWQDPRNRGSYTVTWAFPAAWALVHLNPYEVVGFTDIGLFSWVYRGRVVDLLGLTDRVMAGRTRSGLAGQWRDQQAYLHEEVHIVLIDQTASPYARLEEFFLAKGWREVDGCGPVRVVASPRVKRDPAAAWESGLEERVMEALSRTGGHRPLHQAIIRELIAGGADAGLVRRVTEAARALAPEAERDTLDALRCGGPGEPACAELAATCGSGKAHSRTSPEPTLLSARSGSPGRAEAAPGYPGAAEPASALLDPEASARPAPPEDGASPGAESSEKSENSESSPPKRRIRKPPKNRR